MPLSALKRVLVRFQAISRSQHPTAELTFMKLRTNVVPELLHGVQRNAALLAADGSIAHFFESQRDHQFVRIDSRMTITASHDPQMLP